MSLIGNRWGERIKVSCDVILMKIESKGFVFLGRIHTSAIAEPLYLCSKYNIQFQTKKKKFTNLKLILQYL